MELQDYLAVLRKRWLTIVLVTLLALAAAAGMTAAMTPTYEARAQVFVSVRTGGTTTDLLQGSNFTTRQVKSYAQIVTSARVLMPVIDELGLDTEPSDLATRVRADSPLDSVLINITATDGDPSVASDIANATAASLATEVTELEQPTEGPSPVQISTVRAATPPDSPASPNPVRNIALGIVVGLAAGFGLAILREMLDTKVRTEDHVAQVTDSAVISSIAHDDAAAVDHLIVQSSPMSHVAESFRRLRTNLQFLSAEEQPRALIVTSSLPGEGKSTTAANLALTLADSGARVILVDADLRRPSVADYMGLEGSAGLTTVLIGRASIDDVVQPWGSGYLHVLTSGQIPPNPSELLGSRAMAHLLTELVDRYDHVIIDTPPLLPVTDAAVLSRLTGGAIVVAGANKVHRHQLEEGIRSLETVNARVLGIVLNRVARKQSETYAYDYSSDPAKMAGSPKRSDKRSTARVPARRSTRSSERAPSLDLTGGRTPAQGAAGLEAARRDENMLSNGSSGRWPGEPLGEVTDQSPRHSRA